MTDRFRDAIGQRQDAWRRTIALGASTGIGLPAFGASLAYYDGYRRERLPANLIQAQRDFFGAHTYERTDKPGILHTEWSPQTPGSKSSEAHKQDELRPA
jgi:6-phosphogluconate dehydrogenase